MEVSLIELLRYSTENIIITPTMRVIYRKVNSMLKHRRLKGQAQYLKYAMQQLLPP